MTRALRVVVAALVGTVALGGVIVAPAAADAPAADRAAARYEVDFLTGMIDHHAMAVHMSEMCVDMAVHDELRNLCEEIIAAQSSEIATMQTWLQDWYGVSHDPSMPPGHMQKMERMAAMDPAEFEILYLKTMIRHHRQAIREASGCVDRAAHDELADLCQSIIDTQASEIETLQTWRCEWYERCHGRREAA